MSNPPGPPSSQPQTPSRNNKRTGAFVAIAAVVLIAALFGIVGAVSTGRMDTLAAGLIAVPVVSLACVILGSILTISERTRQFAVGFLITGAIFLFVSAGVCVALFALISSGV
jgi:ABC-type transport system involved in multi-copper enzyme maturation permease subunit